MSGIMGLRLSYTLIFFKCRISPDYLLIYLSHEAGFPHQKDLKSTLSKKINPLRRGHLSKTDNWGRLHSFFFL